MTTPNYEENLEYNLNSNFSNSFELFFDNLNNSINLNKNFLGKKIEKEFSTNEYLNGQNSQKLSITEKDNENFEDKQKELDFNETKNLNVGFYNEKNYLQSQDSQTEYNNLSLNLEENELSQTKAENKKIIFIVREQKPRGKKGKSGSNKKRHSNKDFDNVISTVQVHFITFIVNLVNDIIKQELETENDFCFENIEYKFKKNVTFNYLEKLRTLKIKDILQNKISKKSRFKNEDHNEIIYKKIINSPNNNLVKDVLDMNYLEFFKNFYYNNGNELNKMSINGKDINYSKTTKPFYILYKIKNYSKDILINCIERAYFGKNEQNGKPIFTTNIETKGI